MPRPGPRRPVLMLRIGEEDLAELERLAERDRVNRSEIVRRLVKYGMERMPTGWQPEETTPTA